MSYDACIKKTLVFPQKEKRKKTQRRPEGGIFFKRKNALCRGVFLFKAIRYQQRSKNFRPL